MQRLRGTDSSAMAAVRAIGLSGQMHGAVLIDARNTVLRPAILWNDGRSGAQCAALEAALPTLHAIAGNLAMPGFTAPKLLWMREHEPAPVRPARPACCCRRTGCACSSRGECVSDMSDASGTLWLDVGARRWSGEVLAACGLTRDQMPRLVEGNEVSGQLLPALAERWGLRAGLPVAGGGGDNAASAVGIGPVRPNQGFVSLGTSGVIFSRRRPLPPRTAFSGARLLPRVAGPLAPDVGDAVGGQRRALGARGARPAERSRAA